MLPNTGKHDKHAIDGFAFFRGLFAMTYLVYIAVVSALGAYGVLVYCMYAGTASMPKQVWALHQW